MEEYRLLKKYTNNTTKEKKDSSFKKIIVNFINQVLVCIVLFLLALILTKNTSYRDMLYDFVYSSNFSFLEIEEFIEKHFGKLIPISSNKSDTELVSSLKLEYKDLEEIDGGVSLKVDKGSVVPALESGLVIFNGKKEGYGNVLILEQVDGVEAWYVGLTSNNLNIYDYVEKNTIIGESLDIDIKLYFKKQGEGVDYKTYLF